MEKKEIFTRNDFFNNSVNIARMFIYHKVNKGDVVVDATCGNGNDTLYLAKLVGKEGKVIAFDVLENAIESTQNLLKKEHVLNVKLIRDSHEFMDKYIQVSPKLILFNLGYLPGFKKKETTVAETTIKALYKSIKLIDKLGLILIVVYQGHEEGIKEFEKIGDFIGGLEQKKYNCFHLNYPNQKNKPPVIFGIEKR